MKNCTNYKEAIPLFIKISDLTKHNFLRSKNYHVTLSYTMYIYVSIGSLCFGFSYYSAQYVEAECDLNRVRKKQRDYASSCSPVKHY